MPVVHGTISRAGRRRVSSVDPGRKSKEAAVGSKRQSNVQQGEFLVMGPVERFDLEGVKALRGVEAGKITRALEIGADNELRAAIPPCFGFETERSG
jgi:hypothetical protein